MSNPVTGLLPLALLFLMAVGSIQPVLARGGGGPSGFDMTKQYCRETVVNRGFSGDATRFEQEVRKCLANPVTYPTGYK
jgi:hypothetical protein